MNVAERCPGIGVAKLLLRDFRRVSGVHNERRDGMAEGVEAASRDFERIQNRPEPMFHDIVGGRWPAVAGDEEIPFRIWLPFLPEFCQYPSKWNWQRDRCRARLALR